MNRFVRMTNRVVLSWFLVCVMVQGVLVGGLLYSN